MKICLDAGHGGSDPGAVYESRQEKNDVLKLTLVVGRILKEHGITVVYTRTTDTFNKPNEKANKANELKADYFISFHRNSSNLANTAKGIEILVKNNSGIRETMARNIYMNLVNLGFYNRGIIVRNNLAVLNQTSMPALLLEVGFINSEVDNKLFDSKFNQIAYGIAKGILTTLNIPFKDKFANPVKDKRILSYNVLIGSFKNNENANALNKKLVKSGFSPAIHKSNNLFKVQIGPFTNLSEAKKMQVKLIKLGFDAVIKS